MNAFLFWLIPLRAVSFGDSHPKILEDTGESTHTHAHTLGHVKPHVHACTSTNTRTVNISRAWRVNERSRFYLRSTFLLRGGSHPVSLWAAEAEDWCLSAEAEQWWQWHEKLLCHLKQGHTERQLPPDTGASVPAACRHRAPGPPRHAHMHIISSTLAYANTRHTAQHAKTNHVCTQSNRYIPQTDTSAQGKEGAFTNVRGCSVSSINV